MSKTSRGVLAVIPARYRSSRFPGKPLVLIKGQPLVWWVHRAVALAVGAEQVIVATEDERIVERCQAMGIRTALTRDDHATGTDRVAEVAATVDAQLYVNVQGDEPLVSGAVITSVIEAKRRWPSEVINAMARIEERADVESPNVPKVVANTSGRLLYMSRAPVPRDKSGGSASQHFRQVCVYAFNREELARFAATPRGPLERAEDIEILRFLEADVPVRMVEVEGGSVAVDVPDDVARVERILDAGSPS